MDYPSALDVVYHAIDTINDLRSADHQIAKSPNTPLAGERGQLDSLAFATLLLAVERRVAHSAGQEIVLLEESDFDPKLSAFATPKMLAALIVDKLA
jgi:hypothetical protein